MTRSPTITHPLVLSLALASATGEALPQSLNATGVVGGLSIPQAHALGNGTLAFGLGNPLEPQSVTQSARSVSHVLGVGLAPGLDVVGRFAEYADRRADGFILGGRSDLSANVKFSLPLQGGAQATRVAAGVNDIAGGAAMFRAAYAVVTQPWGPWSATIGAGTGREQPLAGTRQPLDGLFGGIDYRLPAGLLPGTLTLSAEHDGRQPLAGARWMSSALPLLASGRVSASAHRTLASGAMPGHTAVGLFLTLPFGERFGTTDAQSTQARSADASVKAASPSVVQPEAASESASARLGRLKEALVRQGLERVRVGRLDGHWVVEYQNHRYGHHELDAVGLVLGLTAQAAPAEVERIVVSTLKTGQPVMTLSVAARAWRDFVHDGRIGALRDSLQVQRGSGFDPRRVDWLSDRPGPATRLQLRLSPNLAYTVGTEF
ncbi:MAG: YjbH domain-containing protein, partial [Rubrivivax sp.]